MTEETRQFTIYRDGKKDLSFTGRRLADVSDRRIGSGGDDTRWLEIDVYKTGSGVYVVAQTYRTLWQGESDSYSAEVCESAARVLEMLSWSDEDTGDSGLSNLAKEALEEAAEADSAFEGITLEEV